MKNLVKNENYLLVIRAINRINFSAGINIFLKSKVLLLQLSKTISLGLKDYLLWESYL